VVKEGLTYYLQSGRSIMKVSSQPEWSFFGSLIWGFGNNQQPITGSVSPHEVELETPMDPFTEIIG
jgi:hypothetical protein